MLFTSLCNMNVATGAVIGLSLVAAGTYFAISNIYPLTSADFNSTQQLINPNGPEVQFVLFTRGNAPYGLEPQFNGSLNESGFNFENPTKIITHGFMSSIKYDVFMLIKNAFLETGAYNVIGMDWSALCHVEYASAMHGAKIAGQQLGDFINWLTSKGVNLSDIHIIGHSLGAHVAGMGADIIQGGRVARITGLDPAGPGYGNIKEELKLDPQDAALVDVVHTFMRVIGTARPSGHVDFYPNGGKNQPGCPDVTSLQLTESILCNHGRSFELFAESIRNPRAFRSRRCQSLEDALSSRCLEDAGVYMGQESSYRTGLYYFKTRSQVPYSMGATDT